MPIDALPTCQNGMPPSSRQMNDDSHLHILLGYAPSLTCAEPLPVDDKCTCTCRDGAVYNQTRPDLLGSVPTTPGTAGVVQLPDHPCTKEITQSWTKISLPHKADTLEPTEVVSMYVDILEDSVLLVADARERCQHFEVYINDRFEAETYGDGPLDNSWCGDVGEECMMKSGGSHGYFSLPKGNHQNRVICI